MPPRTSNETRDYWVKRVAELEAKLTRVETLCAQWESARPQLSGYVTLAGYELRKALNGDD